MRTLAALLPTLLAPCLAHATGVSTTPDWTVEGNQTSALLGEVHPAGDVNADGYSDFLVSAPRQDAGQTDEGRVRLFLGSPYGVSPSPAWTKDGDAANAWLGGARTAGDVNGDGFADVIMSTAFDEVWGFHGSETGLPDDADWSLQGGPTNFDFGDSLSTAGDVNADGYSDILVGDPQAKDGGVSVGAAYLHLGAAAGPSAAPIWQKFGQSAGDEFGRGVGTAGDVNGDGESDILVGAPGFGADTGQVRLYYGGVNGASATPNWLWQGQGFQRVGHRVMTVGDLNGDGHADFAVNGNVNPSGGNWVFFGSSSGPGTTPDASFVPGNGATLAGDVNGDGFGDALLHSASWGANIHFGGGFGIASPASVQLFESQTNSFYGIHAATAGDVDGDGFSDTLVGATQWDGGLTNEGKAFLYHGGADVLSDGSPWIAVGGEEDAVLGTAVASAGDVNGDGHTDWVIGAPGWSNGQSEEGQVRVYLGSNVPGQPDEPAWTFEANESKAWAGRAVAGAGDVNGDGYADVLFGAPLENAAGGTNSGAAYLWLGSDAPSPTDAPAWSVEGDVKNANLGQAIDGAGDVNGDGFDDVLIGAYRAGGSERGRVSLYLGSAVGLAAQPAWEKEGTQVAEWFGRAVAGLGDVNGDGFDDVAIGAPGYDDDEINDGRVAVYLGSESGLGATPAWTAVGLANLDGFGDAVARAGDVNGDGFDDLLVGAPLAGIGGTASLFLGAPAGLQSSPAWHVDMAQGSAAYGAALAGGFDVDDDGHADFAVGAPSFGGSFVDEGGAFLYLGGPQPSTTSSWLGLGGVAFAGFGTSLAFGDQDADGFADLLVGAPYLTSGLEEEDGFAILYPGNGAYGAPWRARQMRGTTPLVTGGGVADDGFNLRLRPHSPFGPSKVWKEWEVRPFGVPFGGPGPGDVWSTGPSPTTPITSESSSSVSVNLLEPGAYRWRSRIRFDPVTTPWMPASRWFGVPDVGPASRHLRILGKPPTSFVPGDTLKVTLPSPGDLRDATFTALAGTTLKLAFPQTKLPVRELVILVTPSGIVEESWLIDHGGKKPSKAKVKLAESGPYILRVYRIDGIGPFQLQIVTDCKLPAAAKARKQTVKAAKGTTTATLALAALPGATLDGAIRPKKFTGPLTLVFRTPTGATVDLAAGGFASPLPDGGIALTGVPLDALGVYEIEVAGFASKKEKVKVELTPTQPPKGSGTVVVY